jgi:hypothetical protein
MPRRGGQSIGTIVMLGALAGCGDARPPAASAPAARVVPTSPSAPRATLRFRAQALPFAYLRGESGAAWPVETTGGGVALVDLDADGDLDLFFPQGVPLPVGSCPDPPADVMLRNEGNGQFTDVSAAVGLASRGYGQGVTVADSDADGDPDVYVTRYGPNTLWRNDGGRFSDATAEAGVGGDAWSLGAAFGDLDGDRDLDLFVANYFAFDPAQAPFERDEQTGAPIYAPPAEFPALADVLYRNDGNGRFTDITTQAGIAGAGRGMGVLTADLDADGQLDVLVANDAQANALWKRGAGGAFTDVAAELGLAYNGAGDAEANMGIAWGDTDGDGAEDVLITHFYNEHDTLWRGVVTPRGRFYRDATLDAGLGTASRPFTGWGTVLADFDHDGWLDLVVTNGHIRPEPGQPYRYECPPLVWQGQPDGTLCNVTAQAGPYFQARHLGRGLACGDLDADGDLDLVIVPHHARAVVLWNESDKTGPSLRITLQGQPPNRDAIGAVVRVTAGVRIQVHSVAGGGSYLSHHDPRPHFGLGSAGKADTVEVRWPSGKITTRRDVSAGDLILRDGDP